MVCDASLAEGGQANGRFAESSKRCLASWIQICEEKGVHVGRNKGKVWIISNASQTPTLNARPIVRAIKQTCRRGVEVVLLLDLGKPLFSAQD